MCFCEFSLMSLIILLFLCACAFIFELFSYSYHIRVCLQLNLYSNFRHLYFFSPDINGFAVITSFSLMYFCPSKITFMRDFWELVYPLTIFFFSFFPHFFFLLPSASFSFPSFETSLKIRFRVYFSSRLDVTAAPFWWLSSILASAFFISLFFLTRRGWTN